MYEQKLKTKSSHQIQRYIPILCVEV